MSDMHSMLAEFKAVASNPRAKLDSYLEDGKKVIGCMPYFCPEELVDAAGMVPFGMWGAETQVSEARRYLPAFICSIIQTTLELGIRGAYKGLSAVMVPILCDSLKSMDGNWRYAVKDIPLIPVAHAQNRKTAAGEEFTASQYRAVKAKLEEISGNTITDDNVAASIAVYRERNEAVIRFVDELAARPGALMPSQRNSVFKSSYFMSAGEYTEKINELSACLQAMPRAAATNPTVVTCGIIADNTGLLRILDECGITVVDDVVSHESLRFSMDASDVSDPYLSLAKTIGAVEGCPILYDPGKKRFDAIVDTISKRKADGALIVLTKFCDPEEYDIVPLRKRLQQEGIKALTIEVDQQTTDVEQIRTAIETLREILMQ